MEKREIRLYNMILPLWLLWIFPHVWLLILPGNLLIDTEVLLCALLALRRPDKGRLMKRLWWRIWWRGFAADAAGVAWLLLALILWDMNVGRRRAFWQKWLEGVMGDPFSHSSGPWRPWPSPACASTIWIKSPCVPLGSQTGRPTGPPWPWQSLPRPGPF